MRDVSEHVFLIKVGTFSVFLVLLMEVLWGQRPRCSLWNLYPSSTDFAGVSQDFPATWTNPSWNSGFSVYLSISVSECCQVQGRHHEMTRALDHRAGQSAFTAQNWTIYHGHYYHHALLPSLSCHSVILVCLGGGVEHTNVPDTLLSSLGSRGPNSPGRRRLVMTAVPSRRVRLIVLIR